MATLEYQDPDTGDWHVINGLRGAGASRYRSVVDLGRESGGTLMGVPFYTSEYLERGELIRTSIGGRDAVHMHPQTAHVVYLSLTTMRDPSNPHLQLDASLAWINDRIKASAERAEDRLDAMVRRFEKQADMRDALKLNAWCEPHEWSHDWMRATMECEGCGVEMTHEMAVRLGVIP